MSLAIILDVCAEYLRQRNEWPLAKCRVREGGRPVGSESLASPFFVGLDEVGTTTGNARNQLQITEDHDIEISIWRQTGQFPQDRQGMLIDGKNKYLATMLMPSDIERMIIQQLHNNLEIMAACNESAVTGEALTGSVFSLPLQYRGRGRQRSEAIRTGVENSDPIPYVVRVLRFSGLHRNQHSDNIQ